MTTSLKTYTNKSRSISRARDTLRQNQTIHIPKIGRNTINSPQLTSPYKVDELIPKKKIKSSPKVNSNCKTFSSNRDASYSDEKSEFADRINSMVSRIETPQLNSISTMLTKCSDIVANLEQDK